MAATISPTLDPAETTTPIILDLEGPSAVVDQSPERREGGAGGAGGAEDDDEGDEEEEGEGSPEEAVSGRKWGHKKALKHGYSEDVDAWKKLSKAEQKSFLDANPLNKNAGQSGRKLKQPANYTGDAAEWKALTKEEQQEWKRSHPAATRRAPSGADGSEGGAGGAGGQDEEEDVDLGLNRGRTSSRRPAHRPLGSATAPSSSRFVANSQRPPVSAASVSQAARNFLDGHLALLETAANVSQASALSGYATRITVVVESNLPVPKLDGKLTAGTTEHRTFAFSSAGSSSVVNAVGRKRKHGEDNEPVTGKLIDFGANIEDVREYTKSVRASRKRADLRRTSAEAAAEFPRAPSPPPSPAA